MSQIRRVSVLFVAILFAFSLAPASAQEGSPFPDLSGLSGLQSGIDRTYSLDFSALEPEPSGSPEAGEPEYRDVLSLTGFVFEFDTSENAAAGYDAFVGHGVESMIAMMGFENPVLSEAEVADLGDQAYAYSVFNDTGTTEGYLRYVVMQKDAYVFLAIIITESEESSLDADALLTHFAEATTEGHSGIGTFDESGGSTGGLWAFFPDADHEVYAGLVVSGDELLFPIP
jgi:hypothetical protein